VQPLDPTPDLPDPQALASEFEVPTVDVTPDAPEGDSVELFDAPAMLPGTPCWGVACVEGLPDGSDPKRMWSPGSLVFAPTPFPFKTQFREDEGHEGAVISGRVDAIWRDGALIRWVGVMDSAGQHGAEAQRLIAGDFMRGVSIKADDITEAEVEYVYAPPPDPTAMPMEMGGDAEATAVDCVDCEAEDGCDFCMSPKHPGPCKGSKQGKKRKTMQDKRNETIKPRADSPAARRLRESHREAPGHRAAVEGAVTADGLMPEMPEMGDMPMPAAPSMVIYHHGRVRSLTMVAEPAWVECTVSLGESPFSPPVIAETSPLAEVEAMAAEAVPMSAPIVAAGFSIDIPELWPEWWFDEPSADEMAMVSSGAIQITPEGRVWGLLAPAGVDHRGFRGSGRSVQVPRGIDYSEWQNKACIVAGGDGGVYKISAGTVTFGCGHASPTDPRRADPAWASAHYDNSCSVAMRARAGENRYGTWFAGGLAHGLTASSFEQIMGCALSGDWQGGKLKAALLVPVEGFPTAVTASVREKMGTLVASSVPIHFQEPEPDHSMDWAFALVASARFDELADERFDEIARERG
jgi:hypothetical protein